MSPSSYLEDLTVNQLMALIFIMAESIESKKPNDLLSQPALLEKWQTTKTFFQRQVEYYPNEAEEKHYLLATLEAVYGVSPYSDEARDLKVNFHQLIQELARN